MSPGNDELNQDEMKRQESPDTERKNVGSDEPSSVDTKMPAGKPQQQSEESDDSKPGQSGDRTRYQEDDPKGRGGKAIVHPDDDGADDSDDESAKHSAN